ncbi:hypothetical protein SAMN02787142_3213 [Burkholderia sp. WP9]|nr:hypothetical protein SAMN02787142_3213 [Burkholderia sp. WP9]
MCPVPPVAMSVALPSHIATKVARSAPRLSEADDPSIGPLPRVGCFQPQPPVGFDAVVEDQGLAPMKANNSVEAVVQCLIVLKDFTGYEVCAVCVI